MDNIYLKLKNSEAFLKTVKKNSCGIQSFNVWTKDFAIKFGTRDSAIFMNELLSNKYEVVS